MLITTGTSRSESGNNPKPPVLFERVQIGTSSEDPDLVTKISNDPKN